MNENEKLDFTFITIRFRFHLKAISILSHPFMLTNEYFGITIQIANDFDMMFENVRLSVNVPVHLRNKGAKF